MEIAPYPPDPRYGVTRCGRVFRIAPAPTVKRTIPYELKQSVAANGYLVVTSTERGRSAPRYVHRLVAETFLGPAPPGHGVAHADGDRANARLENLRWATQEENMADASRHGTTLRGDKCPLAKLRQKDIPRIRDLLAQKAPVAAIARMFDVSDETIRRVKNQETWSYV